MNFIKFFPHSINKMHEKYVERISTFFKVLEVTGMSNIKYIFYLILPADQIAGSYG
jgi:hypothetical protein